MDLSFTPVNGQKVCEYAGRRFGWLRFGNNGCGVLAVYNALGLLGRKPSFAGLFGYFHAWYRPRFFGVFPWQIRRYFKKQAIPFRRERSLQELEEGLKGGGVAVLTYWNRCGELFGKRFPKPLRGAHSVAVFYEDKFTVCNRYSNRDRFYKYDSLEELLKDGLLIKAFYLKEGT